MQKLLDSRGLVKYLVAAILIAVPLYPKFPFLRIPGTYVAVRLEDLLLLITSLFLLSYFIKRKIWPFKKGLERAILIFLLVGFLSFLSAILITKTVSIHLSFLHWARRLEYFIPFFLGTILIKESKEKINPFIINVVLTTLLGAFVYGVGQKIFSWPAIITQNNEYAKGIALRQVPGGHLNSTFAGHYDLATYLVLILPILIAAFFLVKKRVTKIMLSFSAISGLWLMANTLSRISVVSYLISVVVTLVLLKKYKQIPIVIFISLLVFGFSSSLLDRYVNIIQVTKDKVQEILLVSPSTVYAQGLPERRKDTRNVPTPVPIFEDRSTSIRLNVEWPRALRSFYKNPFLGTGYSSITLATDNDYLRLLGEVGILGFFSFALIFAYLFYYLYRVYSHIKEMDIVTAALITGYFGGLVGILLNAVFIDVFEASKFAIIFWLMTGLTVGIIRKFKNEEVI